MTRRIAFFCALTALVLFLFAASANRALADDPNHLARLQISIWPEYDRPSVLVLIEGTLADSSNLPREISVVVPASATSVVATYQNSDGTLAVEQPFKTADAGNGLTRLTYTVKTAEYHVEYYDNLIRGNPDKTIDFAFQAPGPADQVVLEVQQPLKATNITFSPALTDTRDDGGFKIYGTKFTNVAAGQTLNLQIKYTKADPNPSVQPTAAPVSAPAAANAPAGTDWTNVFVVAGLVTLGLAAFLGFMLIRQRSQMVPVPVGPQERARRGGKRRRGAASAGKSAGSSFCTQCGRALGAEDNFCPTCGAKRRAT